ncbi:hypothetical protein [Gluconobacter sp. Gdi]|uniref:hypothetical protein n=1 Tax=Gluconobacter sp. Gdi TaxID=2691888 RepID=UPI001779B8C8|nr:hypothetical protein [Gluconobacter sp. Gdi]GFE98087.1 hypothetical protein DmGdi_31600 [Gluconobacter sp. Gdi]
MSGSSGGTPPPTLTLEALKAEIESCCSQVGSASGANLVDLNTKILALKTCADFIKLEFDIATARKTFWVSTAQPSVVIFGAFSGVSAFFIKIANGHAEKILVESGILVAVCVSVILIAIYWRR